MEIEGGRHYGGEATAFCRPTGNDMKRFVAVPLWMLDAPQCPRAQQHQQADWRWLQWGRGRVTAESLLVQSVSGQRLGARFASGWPGRGILSRLSRFTSWYLRSFVVVASCERSQGTRRHVAARGSKVRKKSAHHCKSLILVDLRS